MTSEQEWSRWLDAQFGSQSADQPTEYDGLAALVESWKPPLQVDPAPAANHESARLAESDRHAAGAYCQHDGEPWTASHDACSMLYGTGMIITREQPPPLRIHAIRAERPLKPGVHVIVTSLEPGEPSITIADQPGAWTWWRALLHPWQWRQSR